MSGYIGTQPVPQATQTRDSFTCTAGQTSFATSGYTPSFLDVYLNGVKLTATDYTASNGSDVVLASGAAAGDVLEVVAFTTFDVVTDTITAAGTALTLDRTGSDGTILDLKKDGSAVGSIGTIGGGMYIGDGDTGLEIDGANNAIYPFNTSTLAATDGHTDLGDSDKRFKDLYLSGGVYLGGVGSSNRISDYEEGAWTPTWSNTFTVGCFDTATGFSVATGKYIKIGQLVWCYAEVQVAGGTGNIASQANYSVNYSSLPFTPADHGQAFYTLHGTAMAYGTVGNGDIGTAAITPLDTQSVFVVTFTGVAGSLVSTALQSLGFCYRTTS